MTMETSALDRGSWQGRGLVAVIRRAPVAGAHAAATVLGGAFVDALPDVRVTVLHRRASGANPITS